MTHWSTQQYAEYLERKGSQPDASRPPFLLPANEAGAYAKGQLPTVKMNKLEAAYDAHLAKLKLAGEIIWHQFQPWRLRLADGALYTPDFGVLNRENLIECHETKGHWREAARVRIKVAASIHPFKFIAIKRDKSGWQYETF